MGFLEPIPILGSKKGRYRYIGRYFLCVYYRTVPVKSLDTLPIRVSKLLTGTVYRVQYIHKQNI